MKEIANTGLLVNIHQHCFESANLEVFDISRKRKAKRIYSFEEVQGSKFIFKISHNHNLSLLVTSDMALTYNSRRGFLGAIPVKGEIAYHLYSFATSKAGNIVNLIRKSRWHSQHTDEAGNKTFSSQTLLTYL